MLERAPGCLEFTLRRIIRDPKVCLRSRRSLHSRFWSHGANDIELPSWWSLFLDSSISNLAPNHTARAKGDSLQISSDWLFLDFLYPSQTIDFLRRASSSGVHSILRRQRKAGCKTGYRSYTSASELAAQPEIDQDSISAVVTNSQNSIHNVQDLTFGDIDKEYQRVTGLEAGLFRRLAAGHENENINWDTIWESFIQLEVKENHVAQLVAILSYSSREVDMQRMKATITSLLARERRGIEFREAMEACANLGDIKSAYRRLFKAFAYAERAQRSTILLSALVDQQDWSSAAHLLRIYEHEAKDRLDWTEVDRLSNLLDRTRALLRLLRDQSAMQFPSIYDDLGNLAVRLALRVFKSQRIMGVLPGTEIDDLFGYLEESSVIIREHYYSAIFSLLKTKREIGICLSLYLSTVRERGGWKPPKAVLGALLKACCNLDSRWGISLIKKGFTDFYGHPDEAAYQLLMTHFARMGDKDEVKDIFSQFCSWFGVPTDPAYITPLLYVHARTGNILETVAQFDRLEMDFNMTPNIVLWNILLVAYARAGNLDGAFQTYRDLSVSGVEPDSYTFATLMGMLANRGDSEGVAHLFEEAKGKGVQLDTPLLDTQVEALCENGEVFEAMEFLESVSNTEVSGSKTRMWNVLLCTLAFQKDAYRVLRCQTRMREFGIPFDGMTYAALMLCLCRIQKTNAALQILTDVMPENGIVPEVFHYNLVLHGFAREGNRNMVSVLFRKILELYKTGGLSANISLLLIAVKRDLKLMDSAKATDQEISLPHVEPLLTSLLKMDYNKVLASKGPYPGTHGVPVAEAYPAFYFDSMMAILGSRGQHEKVKQLFDEYLAERKRLSPDGVVGIPPVRILTALMTSHMQLSEHDQISELWDIALSKGIQLASQIDISSAIDTSPAPPVPNDPSHRIRLSHPEIAPKILPSRRFILAGPFKLFLHSLAIQGRYDDMAMTISSFQEVGFELSSKNWNQYIQILSGSPNTTDNHKAFELCESLLMPNFPKIESMQEEGWKMLRRGFGSDPFHRPGVFRNAERKKIDNTFFPGHLQPTYLTLVHLSAVFFRFRSRIPFDGGKEMEDLRRQAPNTIRAITTMPRIKDLPQGALLRGGGYLKDSPPQPKRYPYRRNIELSIVRPQEDNSSVDLPSKTPVPAEPVAFLNNKRRDERLSREQEDVMRKRQREETEHDRESKIKHSSEEARSDSVPFSPLFGYRGRSTKVSNSRSVSPSSLSDDKRAI